MQQKSTNIRHKTRLSTSWKWVLAVLALIILAGAVRWWNFGQTQALQNEVEAQKNIAEVAQKEVANLRVEVANLKADPNA
ncbi:MAG TPA: hypothetical protein VFT87_01870, partial [Candidatus Saccharimonadales bacterium]|nr:hypothetical protein [Candidatus Saccharimonadales bacterium]